MNEILEVVARRGLPIVLESNDDAGWEPIGRCLEPVGYLVSSDSGRQLDDRTGNDLRRLHVARPKSMQI